MTEFNTFRIDKLQNCPNCYSDKGVQGAVVNQTCILLIDIEIKIVSNKSHDEMIILHKMWMHVRSDTRLIHGVICSQTVIHNLQFR